MDPSEITVKINGRREIIFPVKVQFPLLNWDV